MKHRINKIAAIFVMTIFALAGASTGYALWYDNLHLDASVETGSIEWVFLNVAYMDGNYGIPDFHCNPGFEGGYYWQGTKDVGWTYGEVTDDHTVTISLNNVYPCYFTMISLYIKVLGTIPVHIQSVTYTSDYETITIDDGTPVDDLDLDGDGQPDIEIWWKDNWFGDQYHPGDYVEETSFWLHIMQPAPQSAQLSFDMTLTCVQYNEYTPPG